MDAVGTTKSRLQALQDHRTKVRLQALRHYIDSLPEEKTDMANWISVNGHNSYLSTVNYAVNYAPSCGTSFCIAGHAVVLGVSRQEISTKYQEIPEAAQAWLGLSSEDAGGLFYTKWWHSDLRDLYESGQRKQAVLAAIDEVIKDVSL